MLSADFFKQNKIKNKLSLLSKPLISTDLISSKKKKKTNFDIMPLMKRIGMM
jgi:hypothetical protein